MITFLLLAQIATALAISYPIMLDYPNKESEILAASLDADGHLAVGGWTWDPGSTSQTRTAILGYFDATNGLDKVVYLDPVVQAETFSAIQFFDLQVPFC